MKAPIVIPCVLLAAAVALQVGAARAHDADPIGVSLVEGPAGEVTVKVARPAAVQRAWPIEIEPPSGCEPLGGKVERREGPRRVAETRWSCARSLRGAEVRVAGLAQADRQAIVRARLADGSVVRAVVPPGGEVFAVPARSPWYATFAEFVGLGVRHLAAGLDHLLFVAGLLLVARELRRAALAVTAFTVGHSLTLCASVLGWVRVPAVLAEVGIALSLVYLAVQVARAERAGRTLPAVVLALGLLHGLGFASALSEAGLPEGDVPLALAGFNVGVELGQLAFIGAALAAAAGLSRLGATFGERRRLALGHAIGAVAAMWCIERGIALFS